MVADYDNSDSRASGDSHLETVNYGTVKIMLHLLLLFLQLFAVNCNNVHAFSFNDGEKNSSLFLLSPFLPEIFLLLFGVCVSQLADLSDS